MSVKLYEYQESAVTQAIEKINRYRVVYLAMGMRTGKTIVSLEACKRIGANKVLILCSNDNVQRAFEDSHRMMNCKYSINISSHHHLTIEKYSNELYDCIIVDEAHNFKAFPKTNARQKALRNIVMNCRKKHLSPRIILCSGTPCPESYSDLFHQLWSVGFETHKNFYSFANQYVNIKEKRISGGTIVKDYSDCREDYYNALKHIFVIVSQEQAGIFTNKRHKTIYCDMQINRYVSELIDNSSTLINGEIIAPDNIVRELQLIRQLCGGFYYIDNYNSSYRIVSLAKIEAIKRMMHVYKKMLIYYYYRAEREMLLNELRDKVTENLDESKNSDKHYIAQMTSMREGITFTECDAIVYYNIDFSAITYLQSQERASLQSKSEVDIVYLISDSFFEEKVLKILKKKKIMTSKIYESEIKKITNKKINIWRS